MKKLLNLIPEPLTRTSGNQKDFKKLNIFQYPANPLWKRLSEDTNKISTRFEHKCIYKVLTKLFLKPTNLCAFVKFYACPSRAGSGRGGEAISRRGGIKCV